MFVNRALEDVIKEVSNTFPVLLLTGPRQVGKTTLLSKMADESRDYVSLDDHMIRMLAVEEPSLFLQRYEPPIIIDEIQYAPNLLPYIKLYVDISGRNGDFWLTGSQMFNTMQGVSESLAGRVGIVNMYGLSLSEINGVANEPYNMDVVRLKKRCNDVRKMSLKEVYEIIHKGSMPALYKMEQSVERFYASYVDTYINRDIRQLSEVSNELDFYKFLVACASRTSAMLNYSDIAKDVGISIPTAKKWLSLLVSSGIIVLVQPYFNNVLKRAVKSPTMYFMDTGLCAYLTRWTSSEALEVSAMSGAFFETFVVSEIVKSYINAGRRAPVYYYRDSDQKEIDLIIEENGELVPIEIKKTGSPTKKACKNFKVLQKTNMKISAGSVICMTNDLLPITSGDFAVPVWLI